MRETARTQSNGVKYHFVRTHHPRKHEILVVTALDSVHFVPPRFIVPLQHRRMHCTCLANTFRCSLFGRSFVSGTVCLLRLDRLFRGAHFRASAPSRLSKMGSRASFQSCNSPRFERFTNVASQERRVPPNDRFFTLTLRRGHG